jgi:hypothetical protein
MHSLCNETGCLTSEHSDIILWKEHMNNHCSIQNTNLGNTGTIRHWTIFHAFKYFNYWTMFWRSCASHDKAKHCKQKISTVCFSSSCSGFTQLCHIYTGVTIKVKQESYIEPLIQDKATIITGEHTKSLQVSGTLKKNMPKTIFHNVRLQVW